MTAVIIQDDKSQSSEGKHRQQYGKIMLELESQNDTKNLSYPEPFQFFFVILSILLNNRKDSLFLIY